MRVHWITAIMVCSLWQTVNRQPTMVISQLRLLIDNIFVFIFVWMASVGTNEEEDSLSHVMFRIVFIPKDKKSSCRPGLRQIPECIPARPSFLLSEPRAPALCWPPDYPLRTPLPPPSPLTSGVGVRIDWKFVSWSQPLQTLCLRTIEYWSLFSLW